MRWTTRSFAAGALAAAVAGDRQQTIGALNSLRCNGLASLPRGSSWLVTMYGIVEAAAVLGDSEVAAEAYELMSAFQQLSMVASIGVSCFGSTEHALGVAALTVGDADVAVKHLRAAVHHNTVLRHRPATVLARARLSYALAARSAPGDVVESQRELDEALDEATALGMKIQEQFTFILGTGSARAGSKKQPRLVGLRRYGRTWEVEFGTRKASIEDSRGIGYLAVLVANPGFELAAVELAGQPGTVEAGALNEAGSDLVRAERARSERDWLVDQLTSAVGLSGRNRPFANNAERARISVGKAIRRAIGRIAEADPVVGEELDRTVKTGIRCSYLPGRS